MMTIEPQTYSDQIEITIKFKTRVFNNNKSKPVELTEQRIRQRVQTVLYPLNTIDKNFEISFKKMC